MEVRKEHAALERSQKNSTLVVGKLQDFCRAIECWNTNSTPKSRYLPLPLGHRKALRREQDGASDLRYALLRLLSNKCVSRELVPDILKHKYGKAPITCGLWCFLEAAQLECLNQDDIDHVLSSFTPTDPFIKCLNNSGDEIRLAAFFEFVQVCQAKATGIWTVDQERARQTDKCWLRLADKSMLRLLQILTQTVARFQWPDEVMGWDEVEDLYPIEDISGQWEEDDFENPWRILPLYIIL